MKNNHHTNKFGWLIFSVLVVLSACVKDYVSVPPAPIPPIPPKDTETLEAKYVTTSPNSVSNSYWSTADFHSVTMENLNTGGLYTDGLMNMTGTINGMSSFNDGSSPELILKAAYDDENLYILAEWTDFTLNASRSTWLNNGPADPLKGDDPAGWTSQKNNDKVALAFEIEQASSAAGTFSNVGCAASCHNNQMKPEFGKIDIWNWNLAWSEPLGYANDMVTDDVFGLKNDEGQVSYERNNIGTTDRSGPEYEWDGEVQSITRADGSQSILDPAYFLLNKTAFLGDIVAGEAAYLHVDKGCYHCHGEQGEGGGDVGDGPSFTRPEVNRFSREVFDEYAASDTHDGSFAYYNQMSATEKEDVITFIRGLSGVPGYYLQEPEGSNTDIISRSNTNLVNVNTNSDHTQYKVLLERKLNTANSDDVLFDLTQSIEYIFGISLMDNDGINHIGSLKETLTFLEE